MDDPDCQNDLGGPGLSECLEGGLGLSELLGRTRVVRMVGTDQDYLNGQRDNWECDNGCDCQDWCDGPIFFGMVEGRS